MAADVVPSQFEPVARPAPLFRREALAHVGVARHGRIVLARPLGYAIWAWAFATAAAVLVAFFACFGYTRKVEVTGMLVPSRGALRLAPMQGGVVTDRRVGEGASVRAGDVLFVVSNEHASTAYGSADRTVAALLTQRHASLEAEQRQIRLQANERLTAAGRRIDDLATEAHRIDDEIALQGRRVEMARAVAGRFSELQASHFVSPMQAQDKQAELIDQQQRFSELQRAGAANARDAAAARATLRDLQIQAERDDQAAQRELASAAQALAENDVRRETLVRAPQAGIVTAITAEAGQAVAAGQSLATLLPAGAPLEADLYAPSRAAGFLQPGMRVLIRHQAYAYQKFGQATGTVLDVARNAMRPDELGLAGAGAAAGGGESVYRVRVRLASQSVTAYGVERPLRSGELVDASVLLEHRRLYEWALEPLFTLTGHL